MTLLASTQAEDAAFIQGMSVSRRARLSAMLREPVDLEKKTPDVGVEGLTVQSDSDQEIDGDGGHAKDAKRPRR